VAILFHIEEEIFQDSEVFPGSGGRWRAEAQKTLSQSPADLRIAAKKAGTAAR